MNLEGHSTLYDFSGRTVLVTGGVGVLGSKIACGVFNVLPSSYKVARKIIEG